MTTMAFGSMMLCSNKYSTWFMLAFVSGGGKHSVLRFEPINNYGERMVRATEVVVALTFFKFAFLDFSSLNFHSVFLSDGMC